MCIQCAATASSALAATAAAGGMTGLVLRLSVVLGPRARRVAMTVTTAVAVLLVSVLVG